MKSFITAETKPLKNECPSSYKQEMFISKYFALLFVIR